MSVIVKRGRCPVRPPREHKKCERPRNPDSLMYKMRQLSETGGNRYLEVDGYSHGTVKATVSQLRAHGDLKRELAVATDGNKSYVMLAD